MLLMMILTSWVLSLTFVFIKHPLSFGLIILLQTILTALVSGLLGYNYWFSYILFLVMVGGMLVLFIYMTSVASNEKFKFSNKLLILYIILILMLMLIFLTDNFFSYLNIQNFELVDSDSSKTNLPLNKLLNYPNLTIMVMLMIYLLITLIAVVKITYSKMGPLRQMKF